MLFRLSLYSNFVCSNKNFIRYFHKSKVFKKSNDDIKNLLHDKEYSSMFPEVKQSVESLQKVFTIQPNTRSSQSRTTSAHLEASELCALVESIPLWKVVEQVITPLKRIDKHRVFGSGKLEELTTYIKQQACSHSFTAVVLGINNLSSTQLMTLQKLWGLPVYDRFSVILQIFRARAETNEAKMQVALAEISFLRSNLYSLHHGTTEHHKEALEMLGGSGETYMNTRKHLLRERETRLQKEVSKIAFQKKMFRSSRKKAELPVVAVVGYTNAGKTSLIQCLTGDGSIIPADRLFATLDINTFTGYLPNNLKVLYVDTIGFISNIPQSLFRAFSASLQDISHADLLLVVSDCSHPDKVTQDLVVMQTLQNIINPQSSEESLIHPEFLNKSSTNLSTQTSREASIQSITHPSTQAPTNPTTDLDNQSPVYLSNSSLSLKNPFTQPSSSGKIPSHPLMQNIVFVHNKADLLSQQQRSLFKSSLNGTNHIMTSLKEGWGVDELKGVVQSALVKVTHRMSRKLRVPIKGVMLPWLYKEAIVESVKVDASDNEKYLVQVTMTPVVDAKFCLKFKPKK